MRILQFSHTSYPDANGIAIHTFMLSKSLSKMGHSVSIISAGDKDETFVSEGVLIKRFKSFSFPFFSSLKLSFKAFKEALSMDFDIIHIHGYGNPFSFLGYLVALRKKKPLVWTIHGYPNVSGFRRIFLYIYKYVFAPFIASYASSIITVSKSAIPHIIDKNSKINEKVVVIGNGIDIRVKACALKTSKRDGICFIGRMDENKRPHLVAEAVSLLRKSGFKFKAYFFGPDEGEFEKVKHILAKNGIEFEHGIVDYRHIRDVYCKCRYTILPSLYEGFPMVLLEAPLFESIPIVTNVGDASDVLKRIYPNYHNTLVLRQKPESITSEDISKRILEIENIGVDKIASEGRGNISNFSWKNVAKAVEKVYNSVLSK